MLLFETLESRQLLTVTIAPVAPVEFPAGKTLIVPIDGTTDASGVRYTVSSSNPLVKAQVLTGLKFVEMRVSIDGVTQPMVFALFGGLTPNTVAKIEGLVASGFYSGRPFHRIIADFMAQTGRQTARQLRLNPVPTIDDEFNPNLVFSSKHLLGMANANSGINDDTGSSEFFITTKPTRWLDFRHTIFGTMISGNRTFNRIMAKGVTGQTGTPSGPVTIVSARMIAAAGDTVVMVSGSSAATSRIAVRAVDAGGSRAVQEFDATGAQDTTIDPPFLSAQPDRFTYKNVPVTFQLPVTSTSTAEIYIAGEIYSEDSAKASIAVAKPHVTLTPAIGAVGDVRVLVAVFQFNDGTRNNWDTQEILFRIIDEPFATRDAVTGVLSINATNSDDTVSVNMSADKRFVQATLNGQTLRFRAALVTQLAIDMNDGDDSCVIGADVTLPAAVLGGNGNDTLTGGSGSDLIDGGNGNDLIHGGAGNDSVSGGRHNDTLYGDAGRDRLDGGAGNDVLHGGAGVNTLLGGAGADVLYGDTGSTIFLAQDGYADTLHGGSGNNTAYVDRNSLDVVDAIPADRILLTPAPVL